MRWNDIQAYNSKHNKTWVECPGYDKAWIACETDRSYHVSKIKKLYNDKGNVLRPRTWGFEGEWVLKTKFNYEILKNNVQDDRTVIVEGTDRRIRKVAKYQCERVTKCDPPQSKGGTQICR